MSDIVTTVLPNGLTVIIEPVENVASAALQWLLPAGSASDAHDRQGVSALLSEQIFRGAGTRSSREFSDALDRCGAQRSGAVGSYHTRVGMTILGDRLTEALPLLVDMIRSPHLADDTLDPVRRLSLQSLDSLNDDPQHQVMLRIRSQHAPSPFNRHGYGEASVLENATGDEVRSAWRDRFVPTGSILTVAGAIDPTRITDAIAELVDGWAGDVAEPAVDGEPSRGAVHHEQDSAQVHLAVAYDAPAEGDDDSLLEAVSTSIMSGGTSGRLFTEVRQKRSLCYSVGASYRPGRDRGAVTLYAGTTPERAQETLDVSLEEIHRMREGATEEEFQRAMTGMKSRLVMRGESTGARAGALAGDYFRLGRARTLAERSAQLESVTLDAVNAYLARRSFAPFTHAAIGPTPLNMPADAAV